MYTGLIRVENQYNAFVNVMQNSTECFHLFRFYIHLPYFGSSRKALWEIHTNFFAFLCSSPEFPLYAYALSLELAALAVICRSISFYDKNSLVKVIFIFVCFYHLNYVYIVSVDLCSYYHRLHYTRINISYVDAHIPLIKISVTIPH